MIRKNEILYNALRVKCDMISFIQNLSNKFYTFTSEVWNREWYSTMESPQVNKFEQVSSLGY